MVTLSRQNSRLPSSDYELIFIIWLSFTDLTCCTCALEAWEAHLQGPTCCKIAILVLKTKSKNRVLFLKQLFLLKLTEKTTSRGERKGLKTQLTSFVFFLAWARQRSSTATVSTSQNRRIFRLCPYEFSLLNCQYIVPPFNQPQNHGPQKPV